eukprot:TRINITY_DN12249_c0_g7_i2.p1 TRINITY_DN12249_c0_g7~~TRINITY_DN12249_c0_g7_i2.p1  ORF type:complete len:1092 (+),score=344.26 TRINITY_DN12249_c0_g7_i2:131-3406(+)
MNETMYSGSLVSAHLENLRQRMNLSSGRQMFTRGVFLAIVFAALGSAQNDYVLDQCAPLLSCNNNFALGAAGAISFGSSIIRDQDGFVLVAAPNNGPLMFQPGEQNVGAVYVFQLGPDYNGPAQPSQTIQPSPATAEGLFGSSLASFGADLAIGATGITVDGKTLAGAVYIYRKDGSSNYNLVEMITASDAAAADLFGFSVALSATHLFVGAKNADGTANEEGRVYALKRMPDDTYDEESVLTLPAADADGEDYFGEALLWTDGILLVGSTGAGGDLVGAVYAYQLNTGTNTFDLATKLTASDGADEFYFGNALAIENKTLVIGAFRHGTAAGIGKDVGAVYVYENVDWAQATAVETQKLMARLPASDAKFGTSVGIVNDLVVVGAPGSKSGGVDDVGSVYVFAHDGSSYVQVRHENASNAAEFGTAVGTVVNELVMVGAPVGAGYVSAYELAELVTTTTSTTSTSSTTSTTSTSTTVTTTTILTTTPNVSMVSSPREELGLDIITLIIVGAVILLAGLIFCFLCGFCGRRRVIEYHETEKIIMVETDKHHEEPAGIVNTTTIIFWSSDKEAAEGRRMVLAYADWVNSLLAGGKALDGISPISMDNPEELITATRDGRLLCQLVNAAAPGAIDARALNRGELTDDQLAENYTMILRSAEAAGIDVEGISVSDLVNQIPSTVVDLLGKLIRADVLSEVDVRSNKALLALMKEGEGLGTLLRLTPEELLLRWVNYHLEQAGTERRIHNLGNDIKDSEAYTYLLSQIAPPELGLTTDGLEESDLTERAQRVLSDAEKMDCSMFVTASDIVDGNAELNTAFVANLFNHYHGLDGAAAEIDHDALMDGMEEGSNEEHLRLWINSLDIEPKVYNFYVDLQDGIVILRLIDKIQPGIVDWEKKVNLPPYHERKADMEIIENCNYAVDLGNALHLHLEGTGGIDIFECHKTLILGFVWQLMHAYTIKLLHDLSDGQHKITEADIIRFANDKLSAAGKQTISNFRDPVIASSMPILNMLEAIRPGVVDFSLVYESPATAEEKTANASLALSLLRKLGGEVFATPDAITEVKSGLILTIFATLQTIASGKVDFGRLSSSKL